MTENSEEEPLRFEQFDKIHFMVNEIWENQKKEVSERQATNIELVRQAGIITRLAIDNEDHKKYIGKDKHWKARMGGISAAASFIGGGLLFLIKWIYDIIKN